MNDETCTLLCDINNAIALAKAAFGAPGDYGYSTPAGKALYTLYLLQLDIDDLLMQEKDESGEDSDPEANRRILRASLTYCSIALLVLAKVHKIKPDTRFEITDCNWTSQDSISLGDILDITQIALDNLGGDAK